MYKSTPKFWNLWLILTVFGREMLLKVMKVLKAFRGKGKAAVCPDTLVLNSCGTSTLRHEHINQLLKVHEITCLNTTVNYNNNNNNKITIKPLKLESSFLTKSPSKFQRWICSNWSVGCKQRLLQGWHHSTIILQGRVGKSASKYPVLERTKLQMHPQLKSPISFWMVQALTA